MNQATMQATLPWIGRIEGLVARCQQNPTREEMKYLRQRRLELARFWLEQPAEACELAYRDDLKGAHLALCRSGLRDRLRQPEEQQLARRLEGAWQEGPGAVLAAMLLCRAHELAGIPELTRLPEWLWEDAAQFLLETPAFFLRLGEAARYYRHLRALVEAFHRVARGDLRDPRSLHLLQPFVERGNFCQAYFNAENLRELYRQRAAIIEAFLTAIGHQLTEAALRREHRPARLKLGVLAHNFGTRTEVFSLLAHIEGLNRERFELQLYALQESGDQLDHHCRQWADHFTLLPPGDSPSQARLIRADDLDILLVAANVTFTANWAVPLAAHRLARLQVALMLSPVTTGFRNVDVMLSGRFNEPEQGAASHYSEALHCVPDSLNCYAFHHDQAAPSVQVTRATLQLPAEAVVYFSGSNHHKIIPELSSVWARILAAVPGSYLVLMPFSPYWSHVYPGRALIERWEQELADQGVEACRLRVVGQVPARADVQALVALADVYLDSYPFSGACSVIDPLMAGCPVVAWRGQTARSLHAASILRAMGLEDLVAATEEDYIAKAVALGRDSGARESFRLRIRNHPQPLPCLDTHPFARKIGTALDKLYDDYLARSRELLALPAEHLEEQIETSASRLAGRRAAFEALTEARIVDALILPFFRGQDPAGGPPHLVDVGACHGSMALPFLAEGWSADLFEPDPDARQVLERNVASFSPRCRLFPVAASDTASEGTPFHKVAAHGLSGLARSPFSPTDRIITVPSVRLGEFLVEQGTRRIDLLKIDTEGWDFKVLEGHDFQRLAPRMVMVEFGMNFAGQTPAKVNHAIRRMEERGYRAFVFAGDDGGNFRRGIWEYRLAALRLGACVHTLGPEAFGNIVFCRRQDKVFLGAVIDLLEGLSA